MAMNKRIKKQWIAALESGDYKKGHSTLRAGDLFCCLGVLCNLHAIAHPKIAAKETNPYRYMGSKEYLPKSVMEWAGLDHHNPLVNEVSLAHVNDEGIGTVIADDYSQVIPLIRKL